jgi:hypothetical protein
VEHSSLSVPPMPKNAKEQVKNKAPVNSTRGCSSRFLQAVRLVGRGSIGHQWVVQGARNSEVAMNVASEPKKSPTANDLNLPTATGARRLSLGRPIYLLDNPLLREPLRKEHVKPRLWSIGAPRQA